MDLFSDEYFMKKALMEAQKAYEEDEIPVGALVVYKHQIIAKAYNQTERLQDVTAHAEMLAITAAAGFIGSKYLTDCTLFVTLEPCPMCAGALGWSQIGRVVFGAKDKKKGYSELSDRFLHPKTSVTTGVLEDDCRNLLQHFFQKRRG